MGSDGSLLGFHLAGGEGSEDGLSLGRRLLRVMSPQPLCRRVPAPGLSSTTVFMPLLEVALFEVAQSAAVPLGF